MIYLDNAATGFPKPDTVIEEVTRCMREYGGNPGRSSHALAVAAAEKIYECREVAARFFGSDAPEQVIFTGNTTMALNFAIKGLLRAGDHVLISDMEHNAVLRPIAKLTEQGIIEYDVFPTFVHKRNRTAEDICRGVRALIKPNTRMLICAHMSNICSSVLPLESLGRLCGEHGILFVVDAAQSAGHLPIHAENMGIDALCVPGHKGLMGPQGSGILLLRKGLTSDTLIEGGSGVYSLEAHMPTDAPERFEAGTLPTPAIAGLCEGIRYVERVGLEQISQAETVLNRYLQQRLQAIRGVRVYVPHHVGSVLLFNLCGIPADAVGEALNRRGICVRAGYHCTALGHKTLKTPNGGAVRVSPGIWNQRSDMDALASAVWEIARTGL